MSDIIDNHTEELHKRLGQKTKKHLEKVKFLHALDDFVKEDLDDLLVMDQFKKSLVARIAFLNTALDVHKVNGSSSDYNYEELDLILSILEKTTRVMRELTLIEAQRVRDEFYEYAKGNGVLIPEGSMANLKGDGETH